MDKITLIGTAKLFLEIHDRWVKQTIEEIAHLTQRDVRKAEPLMKIRPQLEDSYQRMLKALLEQREHLKGLPQDLRDALKQSQLEFAELSAVYLRELEITKKASERLINLIQKAVTQQHVTSQFYGQSGTIKPHDPVRSVAVNKKA